MFGISLSGKVSPTVLKVVDVQVAVQKFAHDMVAKFTQKRVSIIQNRKKTGYMDVL